MSTSNNPPITVAEAAALPDESWLNDGIAAHVLEVNTVPKKAGGNFWSVALSDGGPSPLASISCFTAPKYVAGDNIRITGTGIMKKTYQGKAQITYGSKATVEVIRGAAGIQKAVEAHQEQSRGQQAQTSNVKLVSGQTVGMAMKEALSLCVHGQSADTVAKLRTSPQFWEDVKTTARDIIRISQSLEKGEEDSDVPY